jgi:hypothetical protein
MFESIFKLLFQEETKMFLEEVVEADKKSVKRKKKSSTPVVENE